MKIVPQFATRNLCTFLNRSIFALILLLVLVFQMITLSAPFDINQTPISQNMKVIRQKNNKTITLAFNNISGIFRPVSFTKKPKIKKKDMTKEDNHILNYQKNYKWFNRVEDRQNKQKIISNPVLHVTTTKNEYNLDILQKKIIDGDESILHIRNIENIFNDLSDIKKCDERFYLKAELFKLILHSNSAKSLYQNVKGLKLVDEEALSIIKFSDRHLRMKLLYNKILAFYPNDQERRYHCKKQEFTASESSGLTIAEGDFYAENYDFLQKYDDLFAFYWQKKFYVLGRYLKENKIAINLGDFYNKNQFISSLYELQNANFGDLNYIPIITHPDEGKVGVYLNLHSFDVLNSQQLYSIREYLQKTLNLYFKYCSRKIVFEKMYVENHKGEKIKLTYYGEEVLYLLSIRVRYIISTFLNLNYRLTDKDVRENCNYRIMDYPNIINKTYETINLNQVTEESIIIDVWDWSFQKKCNKNKCIPACRNDIIVYVGSN
ncbi:hypothetical protein EDEG_01081 [Edhazardia aedis USNM 41457]|uniref:Uncharacterized protein n=1 Tax=Edhazardia aedis (strain USNM 41457) TaxID=1003232 RepID=J8ZYI2_EDHAE|nr:hypothetical protein EDEG_01081 [Edhazardia aedis USNM 41457]|eukprot:EJW04718.1 hypothetical protein EDEG_01081 [Edhazardia aedis USNM 41457]